MRTEDRGGAKAFATFRVSGDDLAPEQITRILGFHPTLSYRKGDSYKAGRQSGAVVGKTGVWFLSTKHVVASAKLSDHIMYIFFVLGLVPSVVPKHKPMTFDGVTVSSFPLQVKVVSDLHQHMRQRALRAAVTCFWHGSARAKAPTVAVPMQILQALAIDFQSDFDVDDASEGDEGTALAS